MHYISGTVSVLADELEPQLEGYLRALSDRLRGLRAARGMTRRLLSRHSSISERYLAQLEGGKANPSVTVLWQLASALGVDFGDLVLASSEGDRSMDPELRRLLVSVPPDAVAGARDLLRDYLGERRDSRGGIALIGLRGAGKTTLGRRLADALGMPFFRLSELIEELGGMQLGELFSLGGQKSYRRLERQALEHLVAGHRQSILEVGGSLVSEPATYQLLQSSFRTVWLRASPEEHMDRVRAQGDLRPMEESNEQAMADLKRILAEREAEYRRADAVVDTSGRRVDESLAELKQTVARLLPATDDAIGA